VQWIKFSGTGGTILTATDSTTKVTGLTPLGVNVQIYQFYFKVTDKAGNIVTTQSTPTRVIVVPATAPPPIPLPGVPGPLKVSGIKQP
jgi:hypothetical protein